MDRFYSQNTPEYRAHARIRDDALWECEQSSFNETLIALGAAYQALARYIGGADIYLMPRSAAELESKLRRYVYDAVHNTIAQSKSPLEVGGYSRVLSIAEQSIRSVLTTGSNTQDLLNLHTRRAERRQPMEDTPGRAVATK